MPKKLLVLGAGNMGGAVLRSALGAGFMRAEQICLLGRDVERLAAWQREFPGLQLGNPGDCDALLLGCKPQQLEAALPVELTDGALVISILAGVTCERLAAVTGSAAVCRAMPNLPLQVGAGMTGLVFTESCTAAQREFATALFATGGVTVELSDESQMHALTAVSGSGPAYFYAFAEALAAAGIGAGLSAAQAEELAAQTLIGAGELLRCGERSTGEWRAAVTSKGGTTEAALLSFAQTGLAGSVAAAVKAAAARSQEL